MPKHFDKSEPAERFENLVGQSVLQDLSIEIVLLLIGPKSGWANAPPSPAPPAPGSVGSVDD